MSRPISIINNQSDHLVSPGESLTKSFGARQIVDNVCGSNSSPVSSLGTRLFTHNIDQYPETPEFQISNFINQGGRVIGENVAHAFGTPPSCTCPSILNSIWNRHEIAQNLVPFQARHVPSGDNPQIYAPNNTSYAYFDSFHSSSESSVLRQLSTTTSQHSVSTPPTSLRETSASSDDLLMRYRANPASMKNLKLSDIKGRLLDFAKDQVGSRFIQQKLENSDPAEKDAIFDEVLQNCGELVDDIFGNYVVQKFFEYGEHKHWTKLVDTIIDKVPQHAFQMYACRVLQKALERVNEPLQVRILEKVRGIIMKCMKDQNGNHVIQKAVEKVSPHHIQFVIDVLLSNSNTVYEMSVDPYGCRVVQRCLEYCVPSQTRPIIDKLHQRFDEIAINQYGNYVIQHVVQHGEENDKIIIVRKISHNLLQFATHKYASNVIEKCLELGSVYHKSLIVKSACYQPERMPPVVVQMMKDQYANYVVQKMFDQITSEQRRELTYAIKPHIPLLKQFPYGKHILAKLEKYFQKTQPSLSMNSSNCTYNVLSGH